MTCIALAWTSPEILAIDLDRDKYLPVVVRNADGRKNLELATANVDGKGVVALVDGVHNLARVADVPAKAFIVFDTVPQLRLVTGSVLLDQDPTTNEYAKKRISIDELHGIIEANPIPFTVPVEALKVSSTLAGKILLSELFEKFQRKAGAAATDDFLVKTCARIVGRLHKSTWTNRVRKPALAAGVDVQLLAEMERFIEDSSVSEGLWKGFYDIVENGADIAEVEKRYDVRAKDLAFLLSVLGSTPAGPDGYVTSPEKTKKRRG